MSYKIIILLAITDIILSVMTDIICCYPEKLQIFNKNNKLKLNKQKKWKSKIDYKFFIKLDIYDFITESKYIKEKCDLNGYLKIPFEKITISQNFVNIINKNINSSDISFDFIPKKLILNIKYLNEEKLHQRILNKLNKNYGIDLDEKLLLLKKNVFNELTTFFPNIKEKKSFLPFEQNTVDINPIIINSMCGKDFILIYDFVTIIFTDNYILIISNEAISKGRSEYNYVLISNGKTYLRSKDLQMVDIIKKEFVCNDCVYKNYGYLKTSTQKQIFNYSINSNLDTNEFYDYSNKETKLKMKYCCKFYSKKNIHICKYIKNDCEFEEYYDYNTNFNYIISQCMINNNDTGLRHRGKYTGSSIGEKNISKTITFDDDVVYNKEGDKTITNLLVDNKKYINRTEIIIGWKVGKSVEGELRIIKLCIMPDAQIVRPIDEEYFITHNKERCDKAIVMDIQLPVKDKEISVIPNELVAYSYVYKSFGTIDFNYKVGEEVFPDSFNPDENIGCAQGIHYFQNRIDLFSAYIN